jgi:hypothetical protein
MYKGQELIERPGFPATTARIFCGSIKKGWLPMSHASQSDIGAVQFGLILYQILFILDFIILVFLLFSYSSVPILP